MTLDLSTASRFASIALGHVVREYPHKLDHVMAGPHDVREPHDLHPVFYGSFDWHSCVHGFWLLMRLYRRFPDLPEAKRIRDLANAQFTAEKVAVEVAYLARPESRGFERPYGWAWLLMLAAELERHESVEGRRWARTLKPLALAFADRFVQFLPKATYPVRAGTHFNTAFALALAIEYADLVGDDGLGALCRERALVWYGRDAGCQAWEPSQDDFLSPALVEAECMRRVLDGADFRAWFGRFLPQLTEGEPATLFRPAVVSDRTDGKIAHLDGLNLSRAWCWRGIASALEAGDPVREIAARAAELHLDASLPHVAGDYMGEHWLATFALLALEG
ncbi:DUF2891 domain-containing protein [Caulobacter sp. 17J65-9]|uniref:DUF2891 domain-containing protein n=1 Tax=Caulobacter sp. 17J65-9 TaxID=2709382 RepID=UPI0013C86096|nr:DUF2891 domain-containing protein [Caulobacter sp. 17J65-9]NEX91797.1 DUF2891 domain-containing protein [Caulobacter sp. 17J65-9]